MLQRIKEFCKAENIAPTNFCHLVGWSPATLSNWNKGVRSDKLEEVARKFPRLNLRWLIIGEGSMYVDNPSINSESAWYQSQLDKKDEQIATLNRQIEFLINRSFG
ncbi:MAG: helix-turn-helix transcriptional regulator [Bacteroidales bacterium]|nr:helix-turn-helix transcriptional regulator [Bacteroidales bacterium]